MPSVLLSSRDDLYWFFIPKNFDYQSRNLSWFLLSIFVKEVILKTIGRMVHLSKTNSTTLQREVLLICKIGRYQIFVMKPFFKLVNETSQKSFALPIESSLLIIIFLIDFIDHAFIRSQRRRPVGYQEVSILQFSAMKIALFWMTPSFFRVHLCQKSS